MQSETKKSNCSKAGLVFKCLLLGEHDTSTQTLDISQRKVFYLDVSRSSSILQWCVAPD
jgi:hypothetical protein